MELYANKSFPENYSQKVIQVLEAMSMTGMKKLRLVGSASIRSQLYAGDFDAIETVKLSPSEIASQLKSIVKKVRGLPETYIGDIKCGEEPSWSVFSPSARVEEGKIKDFNIKQSQTVIDKMLKDRVISPKEAKDSLALLEDADTAFEFLVAKKEIKFSTLRWTPTDILQGFLDYRGARFQLEDAIQSGGMIKLDVISNIADRYTEFSVIYDLVDKKGRRLTNVPTDIVRSLQEDILYYNDTDPFKAVKRMYALSKVFKMTKVAQVLVPILNSDLGRLYQIIGDLKTVLSLLERPSSPIQKIREHIDDTRMRMGNIYLLRDFLSAEHEILGQVETILKSPTPTMKRKLETLVEKLQGILNRNTVKIADSIVKKLK